MTDFKQSPVQIATFINPHLFWIFPRDNVQKRQTLEKSLHAQLANAAAIVRPSVEQLVVVHDEIWKRGLLCKIQGFKYTCWLIDYGVWHDCTQVYSIPDQCNAEPALVQQAALSRVVNVVQKFDLEGFTLIPTIKFCPGTIQCAKKHIEDARQVFFECVSEKNNTHRGKINILRSDGHLYDLSSSLVEGGVLAFNNDLFEEAFKKNSELEDFVLLPRYIFSPCTSGAKRRSAEAVQNILKDFDEMKSGGRGIVHPQVKEGCSQPSVAPEKKMFVEGWLKDVKKGLSNKELNYESDDSENNSRHSSSLSVSATGQFQTKQTRSISPLTSTNNQLLDKTVSRETDSSFSSKDSIELNYQNSLEIDTKSDASPVAPNQARSENLRDVFKGHGRPSTDSGSSNKPQTSSVRSETSDYEEKYITMLQKKFDLPRSSVEKPRDMEVKSPAVHANVQSNGTSNSCQLIPNWGTSKNRVKPLNIMPSGMQYVPPQTKCKSKHEKESKQIKTPPTKLLNVSSLETPAEESRLKEDTGMVRKSSPASTGYPSKANSSSSLNSNQKLSEFGKDFASSNPNPMIATEQLKEHCTQGCDCDQCDEFYTSDLIPEGKKFADTAVKKHKVQKKPLLVLKTDADQGNTVDIYSHTSIFSGTTKLKRNEAPKILVHGCVMPTLVSSVMAVPFHADILHMLSGFEQAYSIQSFVWSAIMRHVNVCMVGAPKSGKTMAYLPGICSYLLERQERYEDLPTNSISPIVIILCPGSEVADNVHDLTKKLVERSQNKPRCALAVPPLDKKCLYQFREQFDLLIATPITLIALLQSKLITVKRLCHFVIETADKMLERFPKEIDILLNLAQSMLQHRNSSLSIQMILSAEHWTLPLENLVKRLLTVPVICISSFLEAALYGRVDIQMHFLEAKSKMSTLAELLKEKASICKTVVICNSDSEMDEMKEYLLIAGVTAVFIYDNMDKQEIIDSESKWHCAVGGKYLTLICTDQVYSHSLNISDAVLLVHYSLPSTWTKFENRFNCMIDKYTSPLVTNPDSDFVRCKVHIFVDEACSKQFPKLVQLLQRMGATLSPKFTEYYRQTIKSREMEKLSSKVKLCSNLKLFGKCSSDNRQLGHMSLDSEVAYSSLNCRKRHILSVEYDYSNTLPKSGIIKFKIVHVQDVTSFTVNLLEHTDSEGKVHKWKQYDSLQKNLQAYMAEHKVCTFEAKLGGKYAVYSPENRSYSRCTVQKILEVQKITKLPSFVSIRCLDLGVEKKIAVSFLYELPEKFQTVPAQGIDVFIANTVPPDLDESFSAYSKAKVQYLLGEASYQKKDVYGIGQIVLQLQNIIWVKNIFLREKLLTVNTIVTRLNLRKTLQKENLVSCSEKPLERLYNLCTKTGIALPDHNKLPAVAKELVTKMEQQVQPQWAYFEESDCTEVYIACVDSPSLFYVRLKKFYALFEALQKEIQEAIAKSFYPNDFEVEVGKCYLAKDFGSDDYCRVKIVEIADNVARCFYVDYGDYANVEVVDLKYLSDQLIVKLPFQVIECRLYGIQPAWGEGWESSTIDILCDYIFEPNTDYFRTLFTTTCKQEPAVATGGQKCAILLADNFKREKFILINQLLIDCGEAVAVEDESLDKEFDIPEVPCEEPEDDPENIEDKELSIDDVRRYTAKYKADDKQNNNSTTENVACGTGTDNCNSPDSSSSVRSWDFVIHDPERFIKDLLGINTKEHPASSNESELLPMRAVPSVDYCIPDVVWHQTEDLIKMKILLPVDNYNLRVVRNRALLFKAEYDEKDYRLDLVLYGNVESTIEHSPCGVYLRVVLRKCPPIEWSRLVASTGRMRNIKYDVDCLTVPTEEKKTFLKMPNMGDENDTDDYVLYTGSEDSDSESDVSFTADA